MIKKILTAAALGAFVSAGAAVADPFQIDVGYDATGNGSTLTGIIDELGYTGTLATSIYLGDPGSPGTTVIDTNIESVMNSYGFAPGVHTAIDGVTAVNFQYPLDPSQKNIAALNPINVNADLNGFTDGVTVNYGTAAPNDGVFWGITYDYVIEGQTTATGVEYTSGYFDVFFEDGNRTQILRMNVTGSDLQAANLHIFGDISFDFNGDGIDNAEGDSFIQNFFVDVGTGQTFYDLWLAGGFSVDWILDTNVDPPLPTADQLVALGDGALFRQTSLDGSVTFEVTAVPEPLMLSLFGAGLLALGFAVRRGRRSNQIAA